MVEVNRQMEFFKPLVSFFKKPDETGGKQNMLEEDKEKICVFFRHECSRTDCKGA